MTETFYAIQQVKVLTRYETVWSQNCNYLILLTDE